MGQEHSPSPERQPSWLISLAVFAVALAGMAWLKLSLFPERYISLSYVLPLLLCLWHKDRRLLWSMALGFSAISALKAVDLMAGRAGTQPFDALRWLMELVNIGAVTITVHLVLNLNRRLRSKNAELARANWELTTSADEIARQNAELQAQSEELTQQNEELQQQGEELARQNEELLQQAEELDRQSEELQTANQELSHRQSMLQTLLGCLGEAPDEPQMLERVCQALVALIGPPGAVAAMLERKGDELVLRTQAGSPKLTEARRPFAGSFAALVLEHNRTAFVDDLLARPDLVVPQPADGVFRSVLAAPLRLDGKPLGVVKIYAAAPATWTAEQFRIIEWVAAQCSLALKIMRLQDSLAHANTTLEEQVRERTASLQDLVNELEHFSYTITHDMRAPLRAIRGFAGTLESLLQQEQSGEIKECLERITRSARRMDRLITDALNYSKAVRQELTLSSVDTGELLRGIVESYPDLQPPKARIRIEGALPPILANEAGLTQCFSNLLDNAVKFVQPGKLPEVRIRAEVRDGRARLWFEDNGIGIPEAFRPRLFQMFQRAGKAYDGTGIGLALVRKVAERMGGRVGVECPPAAGSRFWVELKLAAASPDHFAEAGPSGQTSRGQANHARGQDA
jgi:signal transduction histidine kinase